MFCLKGPLAVVMPELSDDPFELPSAVKKAKEASAKDAEAEKELVRTRCFGWVLNLEVVSTLQRLWTQPRCSAVGKPDMFAVQAQEAH